MDLPLSIYSEADLSSFVRAVRDQRSLGIVGIDGVNCTGKSSIARCIGVALDCPVVECDLFVRDRNPVYPEILDLKCLSSVIRSASDRNLPIVVESVMLQLVLAAMEMVASLNIYVRHSWPEGQLSSAELFNSALSVEDILSKEIELCRAIGMDPPLFHEIVRYHKRDVPHERADILYEVCFDPSVCR